MVFCTVKQTNAQNTNVNVSLCRSFSNGSIDEISVSNRSHSSHSKYSPSHASKDSISITSMQSGSNDSDVFDENDEERVIFDMLEYVFLLLIRQFANGNGEVEEFLFFQAMEKFRK